MSREPWFRDGLCFRCTRCGSCCTGEPGNVWVRDAEIAALARRLDLDEPTFRRRYTRRVFGVGTSLIEKPDNDCIFYDREAGCTVYSDRPRQCRTWPFWGPVVVSEASWELEARSCPGMDQGRRFEAEEILALVAEDGLP